MDGEGQMMTTALAIQRATAAEFDVTVSDLRGSSRSRKFSAPRHMAMSLCKSLTGLSFAQIGGAFERDKTSVYQACLRFADRLTVDPDMAAARDRIIRRLS